MRLLKPFFFKTKTYIVPMSCELKCPSSISVQKYKSRRYEWVSNLVKYFRFSFWTIEEKWYKQSNTSGSMHKQTFHPPHGFGQVERTVTALTYFLLAPLLKSRRGVLWTWAVSTSDQESRLPLASVPLCQSPQSVLLRWKQSSSIGKTSYLCPFLPLFFYPFIEGDAVLNLSSAFSVPFLCSIFVLCANLWLCKGNVPFQTFSS